MSATAHPDAADYPARRERRRERRWHDGCGHRHDEPRDLSRWSPWTAPKGLLIAAMVIGFIAFFPIGFLILGFMIGAGRLGKRWARRYGMEPGGAGNGAPAWDNRIGAPSGNAAFDEYRVDTLRRLEEEQKDFAAFLERLRFAKDRAEFEQFMADRRGRPERAPEQEPRRD